MELEVLRLTNSSNDPTFGVLSIDGLPHFTTIEKPNHNNAQNISCIPTGQYKCIKINSPKFGICLLVEDVPNRSEIILGHIGNFVEDTKGCILIGMGFYPYTFLKEEGISDSLNAVKFFRSFISIQDTYNLIIRYA